MDSVLNLKPNYKIIKATNETLAKVYLEHYKKPITEKMIKFFSDKLSEKKVSNIKREIAEILRIYKGNFQKDLHIIETHNIIPNVLMNQFAILISGTSPASSFKANYIALGNGSTTPVPADTQLANETKRGLITNGSSVGSVAYLDKFFGSSEVAGLTFTECGIFCDGTASANSGFLLSRILMNESMASNETLTINATITISSAT